MGAYETRLKIRFGQVDAAGIMFYPRFFDNFHVVFEDMFSELTGKPYTHLLENRRIGFPTVHIETDFRRPFRFGEEMRLVLDVVEYGETSILFRYRGFHPDQDEPSVEAQGKVVVLDLDAFKPVPIPDDIRAILDDLSIGDGSR